MPIRTIIIQSQDGNINRRACVIAGQAYYESSGENSGTPGVWYPFEGIEDHTMIDGTERFWFKKPDFDRGIDEAYYFRMEILMAMDTEWERYKSIECLYASCLLSAGRFPPNLRSKLSDYINQNGLLFPLHHRISLNNPEQIITLHADTLQTIHDWLMSQGADLNNHPQQRDTTLPEYIPEELLTRLRNIRDMLANELVPLSSQETSNTLTSTAPNRIFSNWYSYFCCCCKQPGLEENLEEPLTNNTSTT